MLKRFILFALLLMATTAARAGILVAFDAKASSGNNWVYDVSLSPGDTMQTNDFFTVYDFRGLQKATFTPDPGNAGGRTFTLSTPTQGETPLTTQPVDLSNIDNVVVSLTTGEKITPVGSAQFPIGVLTLTSNLGLQQSTLTNFASQTTGRLSLENNYFISSTAGPVPEPSAVTLLGLGLVATFAYRFKKRARS
jgi:hypothetical protein